MQETDRYDFNHFTSEISHLLLSDEQVFNGAKKPLIQVFALEYPISNYLSHTLFVIPNNVARVLMAARPYRFHADLGMLTTKRDLLTSKAVIWRSLNGKEFDPEIHITLWSWVKSKRYGL